jgi:protocatechuate 3,4-dioxygenase beta subunit
LVFSGRVLDYTGRPLSKAAVVAYHADRGGLYNPPNPVTRTPRLRDVAVTGQDGGFRFSTIRPGPYPDGSEPAHIHVAVLAPAHHLRYVTYWFEGDPLITAERRRKLATDPETVVVELGRGADGVWSFTHDIRLKDN